MWTCFVFSLYTSAALASELFDHNGWIPVSNDIIYNQIRRGITEAPRFTKADDVQILNTDILSYVSQHQEYEDFGTEQNNVEVDIDKDNRESTTYHDDTFDNEPRLKVEYNISPNNVKTYATVRRSKKLADIDSHVLRNDVLLPNNDKPEYNDFLKRSDNQKLFIEEKIHAYEVTEKITTEDERQKETEFKENGYEYNRPANQSFTTNLIKYLSKYNINENENLKNYALSRRPKAKSPLKLDLDKSLQFLVPLRYNNLNHLSVDPLLAVFLSNYGHYLQGQFGLSNNYKNLYGYLASNNIHNNRPFGVYKLFSDTDSSNKK